VLLRVEFGEQIHAVRILAQRYADIPLR
jgi:hypothetical protein